MREHGTVKWYNPQRACGFIKRDSGGEDIYLNRRALPRHRRWDPDEGDRVSFEVRTSEKGLFAAQLEFIDRERRPEYGSKEPDNDPSRKEEPETS